MQTVIYINNLIKETTKVWKQPRIEIKFKFWKIADDTIVIISWLENEKLKIEYFLMPEQFTVSIRGSLLFAILK